MKNSARWAFKALILSVSFSILFGMFSQSLFPKLPWFLSVLIIFFFIFIAVLFDMIGVSFTTLSKNDLNGLFGQNKDFFNTLSRLYENKDKISSFCGDIVGDICGILSGAGGVSLVFNMNIQDANVKFITTCIVSSIIAGLTIFGKAIMKGYAVQNCKKVTYVTAKTIFTLQIRKKNTK